MPPWTGSPLLRALYLPQHRRLLYRSTVTGRQPYHVLRHPVLGLSALRSHELLGALQERVPPRHESVRSVFRYKVSETILSELVQLETL